MGRKESNLSADSWAGGAGSGESKPITIFFITSSAEKSCRGQAGGEGEEEGDPQSVGRGSPSPQPWL